MVEGGSVDCDDVDFGELREDLEGAVRGAAVDDDDFLDGDGLLEDALNALPDALGLVPNGYDDGNRRKSHQTSFCQAGGMFLGTSMWPNFFPCRGPLALASATIRWMPSRSVMFWIRSPNVECTLS